MTYEIDIPEEEQDSITELVNAASEKAAAKSMVAMLMNEVEKRKSKLRPEHGVTTAGTYAPYFGFSEPVMTLDEAKEKWPSDVYGRGLKVKEVGPGVFHVYDFDAMTIRRDDQKTGQRDLMQIPTTSPAYPEITEPTKEPKMSKKVTKIDTGGQISIVNESVVPGLDAMLSAATDGKILNFKTLADDYNASAEQIESLNKSLKIVKDKLAKAETSAVPATGKDIVNASELTYELVYRQASDMFPIKTKGKELEFQIPTLVWKDATGKVVQHPECPDADVNYQLTPTNLIKFLVAFSKGMNTWLYGHTGTGKSTFVEQVAARIGFPVARVNLDSNMERADLVGHIALREEAGATVSHYEEGILPRAMQRPCILLLDEIDAGRPDILFVIQRALEGAGLMITEESGRIIKPHPLFRFAATANTRGQGDEFGIYQGTRNLNTSMIDRFPVFIEFKYLAKATEMDLLLSIYPDLDTKVCEQLVVFANEMRGAFANGEVFQPITPRGLQTLSSLYLNLEPNNKEPMKMALEMVVYDKTTRDTIQRVRELADRCVKVA